MITTGFNFRFVKIIMDLALEGYILKSAREYNGIPIVELSKDDFNKSHPEIILYGSYDDFVAPTIYCKKND